MSRSQSRSNVVSLGVAREKQERPLRECVSVALSNYFAQLEGHPPGELYEMVLQEVEQPLLQAVLQFTGGNQTQAAQILGLNRGTLRKKLRQYDLQD
ncbi:MAG: DNA-binding transcriptional regulator Fis [Pseudomonadota bacterium]|nr:MAG: DNA-binding transcriptional regulator Fis [Pseudomonadota bacterium]